MNPLINAYNYKISQLQEQISFILKENNQIKNLMEVAQDPLDRHFPGWQNWGFDPDLLRKYITPGGGLTGRGQILSSLWGFLVYVGPQEMTWANPQAFARVLQHLAKYLYLMTPEQAKALLDEYGLRGTGVELLRSIQNLATDKGFNSLARSIARTLNPSVWQSVTNSLTKSRRGFTSSRLLAILVALMAAGWTAEQILQYLNSQEGQNEEWPADFIPEGGTDLPDRGSPELTPGETPQTPQIPSGNTPPSQMRPELPY